ncbi:MAG: 2-polyprenyl-3-methyl-5-hydroxy-6-metoxy-1,4-benzoquinol methylase [Pseudohongiellaceae bacterium]|jgi:2-polyprenyl-3-methyl-5-hydroxy-6-metoxy-1,4-benzoquinol methylase
MLTMSLLSRLFRSSHIRDEVSERFLEHMPSGRILDLPAGDGVNSRSLVAAGYEVVAADLFPERVYGEGVEAMGANLLEPLPFEDESFDGVLFS